MPDPSWGSGWPACQTGEIVYGFTVDGTSFPGGVRRELCDLVEMLVLESKARGYDFGAAHDPSYGCWGFNCAAIPGSSSPSYHSFGLAVDINAPTNPQTRPLTTDMPAWMPDLWNAYGFRWGGDYQSSAPDAMHYEFMESVAECARLTEQARANGIGSGASGDEEGEPMSYVAACPWMAPNPDGTEAYFLVEPGGDDAFVLTSFNNAPFAPAWAPDGRADWYEDYTYLGQWCRRVAPTTGPLQGPLVYPDHVAIACDRGGVYRVAGA